MVWTNSFYFFFCLGTKMFFLSCVFFFLPFSFSRRWWVLELMTLKVYEKKRSRNKERRWWKCEMFIWSKHMSITYPSTQCYKIIYKIIWNIVVRRDPILFVCDFVFIFFFFISFIFVLFTSFVLPHSHLTIFFQFEWYWTVLFFFFTFC